METPPRSGPPLHVHHREDESFYVLKGEYECLNAGQAPWVGAGSLLYVPKGTLHAHRNVGEGVGKMLVTQTPGGLYELFFEDVGKPVDADGGWLLFEDQPDVKGVVTIGVKYGIEIARPSRSVVKRELDRWIGGI